jgi:glucose uptake protein GlcU
LLGGLAVLQQGFRHGRALIVTAVNLVVNQVVVVVGGIFCLGESFPHERMRLQARVGGLVAILVGTVMLARFSAPPTTTAKVTARPGLPEGAG